MISVSDRSFIDDTVSLDGKVFVRCKFERCVLKFNGTATFSMSECSNDNDSRLVLDGAAVVTVRQLRALLAQDGPLTPAVKYYLFDPGAETMLGH